MKSIAEYFRDLAADDRYFGAEPPQPDAQMLHQIAEREVNRRVETRMEKNGLVLRQTADSLVGTPRTEGDDRRPSQELGLSGDNSPYDVDIDGDSVAAKLARIRAVVARARANRQADTAFAEDEPVEPYGETARLSPDEASAPMSDDPDDFASESEPDDDSEPPVSLADMMLEQPDSPESPEQTAELADPGLDEAELAAQEAESAAAAEEARLIEEAEVAAAAEQARIAQEAEEAAVAEQARIAQEAEEAAAAEQARIAQEAQEAAVAEQARIAQEAQEAAAVEQARIAQEAEEAAAAEQARIAQEGKEAAAAEQARIAQEAEEAAVAEQARIAREAEEAAAAEQARIAQEAEEAAAAEQARIAQEAEEAAAAELVRVAKEAEAAAAAVQARAAAAPIARVIKLKRTEFEAALAAGEIEEVEDDEELDDEDGLVAEIELDGDADDTLESEAARQEPVAEDDRILADTIAAALAEAPGGEDTAGNVFADTEASSEIAERDDADDSLADGIRDLIDQSSLSADDEQDLAAELAEIEREAEAAKAAAEAEKAKARARYGDLMEPEEAEADTDAQPEQPGEDGDEQALNRLLDETNAKLSETEGSRRRSAIAHLKAAVAATKAERLIKGNTPDTEKDDTINRYRDDLAQVVRPRRPQATPTPTGNSTARERPVDPLAPRPAPLVLVSEQRIDRPAETAPAANVVRPRRVSATRPAPVTPQPVSEIASGKATGTPSFAEFAAQRGASELPDILEAAVAYSAQIEGQTELTRPQILRRAAAIAPDLATSREKGLQSFGQLLRSGRIRKVGLGQFSLNEDARTKTRA